MNNSAYVKNADELHEMATLLRGGFQKIEETITSACAIVAPLSERDSVSQEFVSQMLVIAQFLSQIKEQLEPTAASIDRDAKRVREMSQLTFKSFEANNGR